MTFHAAALMCLSHDCDAIVNVFARRTEEMPTSCPFCGGQLMETALWEPALGPDEDGDDVQVIVVSAPRHG